MKIKVANTAGFCFGVKRAVNLAVKAVDDHPGQPIYTLGPIIHNPQVVKNLEAKGIHPLDSPAEANHGIIILRSHGVTKQEMNLLESNPAITVIDATCPFVRRAQEIVARMKQENYQIIIVGEKHHPEVAGLISYGDPEHTLAISGPEEIPEAILQHQKAPHKIALLAQTTQSYENYSSVAAQLLPLKGETRCFNTICNATSDRQRESLAIAAETDCMIIIGGFSSANTTRLYQLCKTIQPYSYHIEIPEQLQAEWFSGINRVGITAGASTPKWLIEQVIQEINNLP